MLFLLITDKRGALLYIRAVASRGLRGWGRTILQCVWPLLANSLSHISLKNLKIKHDSCPEASVLCLCSWKILNEVAKKPGIFFFSPFLTVNLQEQSKRGTFFHNKTSVSASDTLHFSFYPLDTTESKSRAHRTLSLNLTHQGPECRLYYEGFFLIFFFFIYLKWGGRNVLGK